jgi:hypothetical protein
LPRRNACLERDAKNAILQATHRHAVVLEGRHPQPRGIDWALLRAARHGDDQQGKSKNYRPHGYSLSRSSTVPLVRIARARIDWTAAPSLETNVIGAAADCPAPSRACSR